MIDAADLTTRLIRCPSVTPEEGGALTLIQSLLEPAGFACTRVDRNGTPNLFARWGAKGARTFGFNGHTDVVPPGDPDNWTHPPFSGAVIDGTIWGRGATDMKSGVAAFVAAAVLKIAIQGVTAVALLVMVLAVVTLLPALIGLEAERPEARGGGRAHAPAAVVVDEPAAQREPGELAQLVGLLVGESAATENRYAVRPACGLRASDAVDDPVQCGVPVAGLEAAVATDERRGEPVRVVEELAGGLAGS